MDVVPFEYGTVGLEVSEEWVKKNPTIRAVLGRDRAVCARKSQCKRNPSLCSLVQVSHRRCKSTKSSDNIQIRTYASKRSCQLKSGFFLRMRGAVRLIAEL